MSALGRKHRVHKFTKALVRQNNPAKALRIIQLGTYDDRANSFIQKQPATAAFG